MLRYTIENRSFHLTNARYGHIAKFSRWTTGEIAMSTEGILKIQHESTKDQLGAPDENVRPACVHAHTDAACTDTRFRRYFRRSIVARPHKIPQVLTVTAIESDWSGAASSRETRSRGTSTRDHNPHVVRIHARRRRRSRRRSPRRRATMTTTTATTAKGAARRRPGTILGRSLTLLHTSRAGDRYGRTTGFGCTARRRPVRRDPARMPTGLHVPY